MSNDQQMDVEVKNHDFDGIREYDNPLPMWWLWTFFGTIIFSFGYYMYYEMGSGKPISVEYAEEVAAVNETRAAHAPKPTEESEESLAAAMAAPEILKTGEAAFNRVCVACHAAQLQGLVGPNLTDQYWIHGQGTRVDMVKVIRSGVPDKGMPPWEGVLKNEEILGTVAYILSKKGSSPAGGKPPQGNLVETY